MRVQLQNDRSAEVFSRQLLDIGNGQLPIDETRQISLPDNFCNLVTSKEELISKVFPNIHINYRNHNWLSERAVLAAKNKDVYQLNHFIQSSIQSEEVIYKSIDTVVEADEVVNYPSEFLNSLDLPGMPPHVLKLKTGVPVIMLRNVNQPKLCNATRLAVKKLMNNVVEATILTGPFKGEDVLIPRIPMIPTDTPFKFKRLQFPIQLAFAITINKAQGQSLELCGLDLSVDCFSHGQLYVACSRFGKPDSLYIYANNVNQLEYIKLYCRNSNLGPHTGQANAVRGINADQIRCSQLASLDKNNALREIKLRLSYLQGKSTTMSVIAHQTEKEWISANEKSRQRMLQTQAESAAKQHAARLEEAHLRAHHSCFTTSERC
ncbi:ATP-dependent DNA helicase [Trichonephila clavipes]|nr:ATP-dependent DNA helicase [Trichonephila clavipes]